MPYRSTLLICFLLGLLLAGSACSLNPRLAAAIKAIKEPASAPTRRLAVFPAIPATPAGSAQFNAALVNNVAQPEVLPTLDALGEFGNSTFLSPVEMPTPFGLSSLDTSALSFSAPVSPVATPTPAASPTPGYDYLLAEFFNSPTTNNFLMIYVAVVDPKEIPIGDMRVVATRLDQNLTYQSPLSTWHYEGYSAPGEVVKSGNTKFEPPGGIETADWILHLEDTHGVRQSEDVPFRVDGENKQWYFIKFRRIF
jgi:hypothetical protein